MGKKFQNASSLKTNCPGMIIGRVKNTKFAKDLPMIDA
jgi:hypothetical protein